MMLTISIPVGAKSSASSNSRGGALSPPYMPKVSMKKLKAIIWDVDGTLVDSEELHRKAFNHAFNRFEMDWHWDRPLYNELLEVTGGKERIRHYIQYIGSKEELLPTTPEEIHAVKTDFYYRSVCEGGLVLREGVEPIIDSAVNKGIRLAIATTTTLDNVEALFSSGVLNREHWEVIVAGDQVKMKKPAPDVYLEALKRLDLAPMSCLAVEDSENGLNSAIEAGLPTIVTTNRYTINQTFGSEIARVHNLDAGIPTVGGTLRPITIYHFEAWHAEANALASGLN